MDYQVSVKKLDLVLVTKKKRTGNIAGKQKKLDSYVDLTWEIMNRINNMKEYTRQN